MNYNNLSKQQLIEELKLSHKKIREFELSQNSFYAQNNFLKRQDSGVPANTDAINEYELQLILDMLPLSYHAIDKNGKIIAANQAWLNEFGYRRDEIIGKPIANFIAETQKKELEDFLTQPYSKHDLKNKTAQFIRKDGKKVDVIFDCTVVFDDDGNFRLSHCLAKNISQQKKHEEYLSGSLNLIRSIADSVPVMIWLLDNEGNFLYVNDEWQNFTGRKVKEKFIDFTDEIIDPEDFKIIQSMVMESLQKKTGIEFETKILSATGEYKWIHAKGVPFNSGFNELEGMIGICIDIHERKLAEFQFERYFSRMQESVQLKDSIFAIMSHELTLPVNYINELALEIAREINKMSGQEIKNAINSLNEETAYIKNMLSNMIEWTKLHKHYFTIEKSELLLRTVIENIVNSFKGTAIRKKVRINNYIDINTVVYSDINFLSCILRNLISNAIKYTKPGSSVDITSQMADNIIEISITDYGMGMKEERVKKLFKPDGWDNEPGTAGETGAGIGLILCHELVKHIEGEIKVESKPGKGSTFTVVMYN